MFGTQSRKSQATKAAEDAWDYLTSAVDSAGGAAKYAGRRSADFAGDAGSRVGSVADEAWERANRAYDALAGRRSSPSWLWLVAVGVAGAAVGWLAATAGPKAVSAAVDRLNEDDEEILAPTSSRVGTNTSTSTSAV